MLSFSHDRRIFLGALNYKVSNGVTPLSTKYYLELSSSVETLQAVDSLLPVDCCRVSFALLN